MGIAGSLPARTSRMCSSIVCWMLIFIFLRSGSKSFVRCAGEISPRHLLNLYFWGRLSTLVTMCLNSLATASGAGCSVSSWPDASTAGNVEVVALGDVLFFLVASSFFCSRASFLALFACLFFSFSAITGSTRALRASSSSWVRYGTFIACFWPLRWNGRSCLWRRRFFLNSSCFAFTASFFISAALRLSSAASSFLCAARSAARACFSEISWKSNLLGASAGVVSNLRTTSALFLAFCFSFWRNSSSLRLLR